MKCGLIDREKYSKVCLVSGFVLETRIKEIIHNRKKLQDKGCKLIKERDEFSSAVQAMKDPIRSDDPSAAVLGYTDMKTFVGIPFEEAAEDKEFMFNLFKD